MTPESTSTWTDRLAPGQLGLVQDFLNAPDSEPTPEELHAAAAIRAEAETGESQAAIAARYGVSQQLVSAILRNKRAATVAPRSEVAAPTLGTPVSARIWFQSRGFELGEPSPAAHARLLRLREALIALCFANNGHGDGEAALCELSLIAAEIPLLASFAPAPRLIPGAPSHVFEATVLAAAYDALRDGTWARLKACPADRCRHVFYDTSRNRTSTWCSMAICGNRTKVRNYQQRAREARQP